jgi:pyrrolysine biosynthesis protein PylC
MMACSETEFADIRTPKIIEGLFGSDDMITDYEPDSCVWRCAMINSAADEKEMERKRSRCIERIMDECGIKEFTDVRKL